MDFEQFFKELKSDEVWFTNATMNHLPDTITKTANQIYMTGMTDPENFKVIPMKEHRRHLFNKLSKLAPDKVKKPWYIKESDKDKEPERPPLTGEERQKKIQEWLDALEKTPKAYAPPKLTSQQIKEEGDWLAKKVPPHPSTTAEEVTKRIIHHEYLKDNYNLITGEALESWMPEHQWIELQKA